ncbi:pirin family protein [Desulforhopalus sp. IMCC35007]|uniref:pirin family protein n=1 Tax=Desulforhopalus sp. IMCC35007 TaxID=2569543 RepID=UPI0010AE3D8A|nr:pirin family protein [Desulforhopalus sp. IMCC35007]TKB07126.1 pirin family protein [Desulforhopalus sp. IMCC35007]
MKSDYHKNESRGLADHGWLVSRHTFSFADYYNPERMNFGLLRVLNDDIVKPAMGFATHPHDNMEIVSIPLSGSLRHQDSMENKHIISTGEVQIMSAGSGLTHSEYNNSPVEDVNFLQIWVLPRNRDIAPRYGQKLFDLSERRNRFQVLVSPRASEKTIWINQDAWFSRADIDVGQQVRYEKHNKEYGVYFFIIEGNVSIDGNALNRRDGLGLHGREVHTVLAATSAEILAIEVPLTQ